MQLAKIMLAGVMLAAVPSIALAQQSMPLPEKATASQDSNPGVKTGGVSVIDRIKGAIVIKQTQSGTVGASGGGVTEQLFAAPANLIESVHAGDQVKYSVKEADGTQTITKIDKQ